MSRYRILYRIIFLIMFLISANCYAFAEKEPRLWWIASAAFLAVNLLCGFTDLNIKLWRRKVMNHGVEALIIFVLSVAVSLVYHILLVIMMPTQYETYLWSALVCYIAHLILFWNGIICVYATSVQLGIKQRVIGLVCGLIPVAHLFALRSIIRTTFTEVKVETEKEALNRSRESEQICKTKYPILMVHGVFFRDSSRLNYWGRVPAELTKNGAVLYYGEHQSALSVADSAGELAKRIKQIAEESGCEKVNIIAHSKGGLDARYAIAKLDVGQYVASLTTVNTPHRGCNFADHLLSKIAEGVKDKVAAAYNAAARTLGDTDPDFLAAVGDLTAEACERYDRELTVPEGIFCQSIGSVLKKRTGGKFPLNVSYPMVKKHDGENDGLVSVDSFAFGESCRILYSTGERGISHADMIDLNRENIPGFDVREFYVQLVSDLRKRGL